MSNASTLVVFTDGACIHNGRPNAKAAFACVWPESPQHDVGMPLPTSEQQTNNRAEYRAFLHALQQAGDIIDVHCTKQLMVYTDSKLMIDTFSKWVHGWQKNNWHKSDGSKVANLDLILSIVERMKQRKVVFHHVRAHTGKKDWASVYNDKVDKLARSSISHVQEASSSTMPRTLDEYMIFQKHVSCQEEDATGDTTLSSCLK